MPLSNIFTLSEYRCICSRFAGIQQVSVTLSPQTRKSGAVDDDDDDVSQTPLVCVETKLEIVGAVLSDLRRMSERSVEYGVSQQD